MLAILGPVLVDAGRAAVNRFIVPDAVKPSTMAEVIQLRGLDIQQFEIMHKADSSGESYRWVEAIRKLQRPLVVFGLLVAFCINPDNGALSASFQAVGWYLFGERTRSMVTKK
jgi:hypothetical protein